MLPVRKPANRTRQGAAAVELVVCLPLLVLLFAAAADFGRVFYATQVLESAASAGASYASGSSCVPSSVSPASAAVSAAVSEGATLNPALAANQVTVSTSGSTTVVTVQYNFPLLTGFLVPGGSVALQRTVTAPVSPTPGN